MKKANSLVTILNLKMMTIDGQVMFIAVFIVQILPYLFVVIAVKTITRADMKPARNKSMRAMNQEIKFRAWDLRAKRMIDWDEIKRSLRDISWDAFMFEKELMQYTGLNDKNTKEIYECDIVSQQAFNGEEYQLIGVVEYNQSGFCLKCISSNKKSFIGEYYSFPLIDNENRLRKGNIIGNIFENPDLINKQLLEAAE
jgi:uncharacterized phage protein (TIGR01671 family)